jgi:hypothetical protein
MTVSDALDTVTPYKQRDNKAWQKAYNRFCSSSITFYTANILTLSRDLRDFAVPHYLTGSFQYEYNSL